MKTRFLLPLLLLSVASYAQTIDYKGTSVQLGPKAFLVDGTVEEPMCIYIEPWVYWVDDPYNPRWNILCPAGPRP